MYHVKLKKARSFKMGQIKVNRKFPDYYTEDKEAFDVLMRTGYFADETVYQMEDKPAGRERREVQCGHLDTEQLEAMNLTSLEKLAIALEADTANCKTKSDYINAITAVEVGYGPEQETEESTPDFSGE